MFSHLTLRYYSVSRSALDFCVCMLRCLFSVEENVFVRVCRCDGGCESDRKTCICMKCVYVGMYEKDLCLFVSHL